MDVSDRLSMHPRKRVSQACVPCSRRKTKCDGGLPICGQCLHRGIQDCIYPVSKRNKRERRTISSLPDSGSGLGPRSSPAVRTPGSNYNLESSSRATHAKSQSHDDINTHESSGPVPMGARVGRGLSTRTAPTALPEIPRDVSARLFKAYFDTIHPTWPILYKPIYDMLDHQRLLDTIAQQLLYAIYSIAACVQPADDSAKPRAVESSPAPPSLLFQAALLALGNDHTGDGFHPLKFLKPSIESCQALTILALQQHGVAESESAAVLCSLACGMAIELRLHREMKANSAPIDAQVRSRLWWSIFILDKMISSELARPVLLRAEDTDTPYPSALESDEYQLLSLKTLSQGGPVSVKTHTISGFHTTIQFSKLVERVLREIYSVSGKSVVRENLAAAEEARMRLWQELKDYHHMLDLSPLKLDMSSSAPASPVTITNMVWMWCITILVHRPFVPHKVEINDMAHPLHICVMAAQNVCSILEKYSENLAILSCDIIFPIFTSANILSYASDRFNIKDPESQRLIKLCVRWLAILGKNWKNAGIFKDTLSRDLGAVKGNGYHPTDRQGSGPGWRPANGPSNNEWQGASESSPANDRSFTPEDWAFLENLGDPSDELYTMDNSFREVLAKQFDTDRIS